MQIDGKRIASEIKNDIKKRVEELKQKNIIPKIAIITLGDEASWEVYVRQKLKIAEELGIKAVLLNLEDTTEQRLLATIDAINNDPNYHGIIVQRPLPAGIDREKVVDSISREKDIDGFREDSPFEVPLWLAAKTLTEYAIKELGMNKELTELNIAVVGKGETAGGPVARGLEKLGAKPAIVDSKTEDRESILKSADIVFSCVGKERIVVRENIKAGAILIGVGIRSVDGRARGDYEESEIEDVAGAYTPTPGGVGPVNLSYLYKNLITAAMNQTN